MRRLLIAPLLLLVPALPAAEDGVRPQLDAAHRFARALVEGRLADARGQCDNTLRSQFSEERLGTLRAGLLAQQGTPRGLGEAWYEGRQGIYALVRVPVAFDAGTVDLRIVVDPAERISGLWFVEHEDPPRAAGARGPTRPKKERELSIGAGENGLPATLSLPRGRGPFPAVVLVHGSGPNDRDETVGPNRPFRDIAWGLAARGVAVLRYDKRSLVHPEQLAALGESLTVREEVIDDALEAIRQLRTTEGVDPERVFVLGHSLGGMLLPSIAAEAPELAGGIVLAGPTRQLHRILVPQLEYVAAADGETDASERARIEQIRAEVKRIDAGLAAAESAAPPTGALLGVPFGYWRDLSGRLPLGRLASARLPLLVLQGGRDYQVTREDFEGWEKALSSRKRACLKLYPALDHLFRKGEGPSTPADYRHPAPVEDEVLDDLARWIRRGKCP